VKRFFQVVTSHLLYLQQLIVDLKGLKLSFSLYKNFLRCQELTDQTFYKIFQDEKKKSSLLKELSLNLSE